MSEHYSAKNLSAARFFKDDVQARCIFWKTPGNVFTADVMDDKKKLSLL